MDALQGAIDIDTNIFLFINGMHNTFFDYFMSAYSGKWVWGADVCRDLVCDVAQFSLESHFVLHDRPCAHNYYCRPDMCNMDTSLCPGAYASF